MILVCPNCDARYTLRPNALGAEGKDVKCAKCAHKWYQRSDELLPAPAKKTTAKPKAASQPVDKPVGKAVDKAVDNKVHNQKTENKTIDDVLTTSDDASADSSSQEIHASLEDEIPNAVKPQEDSDSPLTKKKSGFNIPKAGVIVGLPAKLAGYGAALAVVGLILAGLVMFKSKAVSAWPPASQIYQLAGFSIKPASIDLKIENLIAKLQQDAQGRSFLTVEGRIINATDIPQNFPDLVAQLRSTNGEDGDQWIIKTPLDSLQPDESFSFKSDYANLPRGVGSVNLTFNTKLN